MTIRLVATAAAVAAATVGAMHKSMGLPPMNTVISIVTQEGLAFRHCNYQGFATNPAGDSNSGDFQFVLKPALNGAPLPAVSLQSMNYPSRYLAPGAEGGVQATRVGIIEAPIADDASWTVVPGLGGVNSSLQSLSKNALWAGLYLTQLPTLSGSCAANYPKGDGDVVVAAAGAAGTVTQTWYIGQPPPPPPPAPMTLTIAAAAPDHVVNPHYQGCHVDPGYIQEPLTWSPSMVYGPSFETAPDQHVYAWTNITSNSAVGSAALDATVQINPKVNAPSLSLKYTSGSGLVAWANGGIGNAGMSWQAGAEYAGYAWVMAPSGAQLYVGAHDRDTATADASATLTVPPSPQWQRVNFTLVPAQDATCVDVGFDTAPADMSCGNRGQNSGYACLRCSGLFVIGLAAPGSANIGFVDFAPGPWATAANGLVQKRTADIMQAMGIAMIRQGGTVSQTFAWKDWRGEYTQRAAMQHYWAGRLIPVTWGPFEFLDTAAELGIEPVLTFAYDLNSAEDWADLVEYCWGNETTTWGAVRAFNDSHPAPYQLRTIELGNEQANPDFVAQIAAIEARRLQIGSPEIWYMYPQNQGVDNSTAQQILSMGGPALAARVMPDIHVGAGGAVAQAERDLAAMPDFPQSAINCEVNAGRSDLTRAVTEASDLQAFINANASMQQRLRGRTASFCTSLSSQFDGFDQALSFWAPNASWLQPPGYTHALVSSALRQAPNVLSTTLSGSGSWLSASATLSDDRSVLVVQLVNSNYAGAAGDVILTLADASFTPAGVVVAKTLADPAATADGSVAPDQFTANTLAHPTYVSPVTSALQWPAGSSSMTVPVPAYSFMVLYVYSA